LRFKCTALFLIASACLNSCATPAKKENIPPLPLELHITEEPKCKDATIEVGRWHCPPEINLENDLPCWNGVFYDNMNDCPKQIIEKEKTYTCWGGEQVPNYQYCPPIDSGDSTLICWDGTLVVDFSECPPEPQIIEEYCWDGETQVKVKGKEMCPPLPDNADRRP